jgi:hypothetical protein
MGRLKISDISFCETQSLEDSQVRGGLSSVTLIASSTTTLSGVTTSHLTSANFKMDDLLTALPTNFSRDEIATISPLVTTSSGNATVKGVTGTFKDGGVFLEMFAAVGT